MSFSSRDKSDSDSAPKKTLKKFRRSFAKLINSPERSSLKRLRLQDSTPNSSDANPKLKHTKECSDNESQDEGEILDRDRLRNLDKKIKRRKKRKKHKTRKIKKKRKGEDH